ncbi:hypothetical protein [Streptosporangium roseum]|uniref:hypothetical protein n=1 Tax=Streptosporangium roseum TaxID=2001 RepID=UPI00331BD59F
MFEIIIPVETLEVDSRYPLFVGGQAWVEIEGVTFPGAHWTDTPLSVLGTLHSAISAVRQGESADVYFFEGPYFLKIFPVEDGSTPLQLDVVAVCDRSDEGVVEARAKVTLSEVVKKYNLTLSSVHKWAATREEVEVLDILSRIPTFVEI